MKASRKHNSVAGTMHFYMQGSGFEPMTPHLGSVCFRIKKK